MNSPGDEIIDNEEFERILATLPREDADKLRQQKKRLLESTRLSAFAGIWAQNLSHNLGRHGLDS